MDKNWSGDKVEGMIKGLWGGYLVAIILNGDLLRSFTGADKETMVIISVVVMGLLTTYYFKKEFKGK